MRIKINASHVLLIFLLSQNVFFALGPGPHRLPSYAPMPGHVPQPFPPGYQVSGYPPYTGYPAPGYPGGYPRGYAAYQGYPPHGRGMGVGVAAPVVTTRPVETHASPATTISLPHLMMSEIKALNLGEARKILESVPDENLYSFLTTKNGSGNNILHTALKQLSIALKNGHSTTSLIELASAIIRRSHGYCPKYTTKFTDADTIKRDDDCWSAQKFFVIFLAQPLADAGLGEELFALMEVDYADYKSEISSAGEDVTTETTSASTHTTITQAAPTPPALTVDTDTSKSTLKKVPVTHSAPTSPTSASSRTRELLAQKTDLGIAAPPSTAKTRQESEAQLTGEGVTTTDRPVTPQATAAVKPVTPKTATAPEAKVELIQNPILASSASAAGCPAVPRPTAKASAVDRSPEPDDAIVKASSSTGRPPGPIATTSSVKVIAPRPYHESGQKTVTVQTHHPVSAAGSRGRPPAPRPTASAATAAPRPHITTAHASAQKPVSATAPRPAQFVASSHAPSDASLSTCVDQLPSQAKKHRSRRDRCFKRDKQKEKETACATHAAKTGIAAPLPTTLKKPLTSNPFDALEDFSDDAFEEVAPLPPHTITGASEGTHDEKKASPSMPEPFNLIEKDSKKKNQHTKLRSWLSRCGKVPLHEGQALCFYALEQYCFSAAAAIIETNIELALQKNLDGHCAMDLVMENVLVEEYCQLFDKFHTTALESSGKRNPLNAKLKNGKTILQLAQDAELIATKITTEQAPTGKKKGRLAEMQAAKKREAELRATEAEEKKGFTTVTAPAPMPDGGLTELLHAAIREHRLDVLTNHKHIEALRVLKAYFQKDTTQKHISSNGFFGALALAIYYRNFEAIEFFLNQITNPTLYVFEGEGETWLHAILSTILLNEPWTQEEILELITCLCNHPYFAGNIDALHAFINKPNRQRQSALHLAVTLQSSDKLKKTTPFDDGNCIVQYLMAIGANKDATNPEGLTPLKMAVKLPSFEIVKSLFRESDAATKLSICLQFPTSNALRIVLSSAPEILLCEHPNCIPLLVKSGAYNIVLIMHSSGKLELKNLLAPLNDDAGDRADNAVTIMLKKVSSGTELTIEEQGFITFLVDVIPSDPTDWSDAVEEDQIEIMIAALAELKAYSARSEIPSKTITAEIHGKSIPVVLHGMEDDGFTLDSLQKQLSMIFTGMQNGLSIVNDFILGSVQNIKDDAVEELKAKHDAEISEDPESSLAVLPHHLVTYEDKEKENEYNYYGALLHSLSYGSLRCFEYILSLITDIRLVINPETGATLLHTIFEQLIPGDPRLRGKAFYQHDVDEKFLLKVLNRILAHPSLSDDETRANFVNAATRTGITVLHHAAGLNNNITHTHYKIDLDGFDIVKLLLVHGANPFAMYYSEGEIRIPLDEAIETSPRVAALLMSLDDMQGPKMARIIKYMQTDYDSNILAAIRINPNILDYAQGELIAFLAKNKLYKIAYLLHELKNPYITEATITTQLQIDESDPSNGLNALQIADSDLREDAIDDPGLGEEIKNFITFLLKIQPDRTCWKGNFDDTSHLNLCFRVNTISPIE